jgi:putative transposase
MARLARSTIVGYPHQVTQRGNREQIVFEEDADYRRYLGWLRECAERYGLDIWAYCLMWNHVHFICVPKAEGALAHGFNTLHMRYAQYFHGKKGVTGPLWKGRFLSCMLDDRSVFEEVRYIENNPVRAGIVERAEDYPWSSARHHVLGEEDPLIGDASPFKNRIDDWRAYLDAPGNEPVLIKTRQCLKTGRPAGNTEWVRKLETIVGRRLEALPRGRPRKVQVSPVL